MIHGIYVRAKPKYRWKLVGAVASAEAALRDKDKALDKAKSEGFSNAEAAIKTFESSYFIPENLPEIKTEDKILLN